ncbi:MAG TPA: hypothetical protein VFN26_12850 [Candidatus Acidoferrum sp.]|nr:hypothetical protein [Candidatus Acidoferrum sp.]
MELVDRFTLAQRLYAPTATTAIILTPARPTDITARIILWAEFSSARGHGSMGSMAVAGMVTMVAVIMAAAFTDADLIETTSGTEETATSADSEAVNSMASEAATSTEAVVASFAAVEVASSTVEEAAVSMEADTGKRSEFPIENRNGCQHMLAAVFNLSRAYRQYRFR